MNSMSKSIKCQCISVCLSNNILVGEIKGVPLYCLCSRQHRKKNTLFYSDSKFHRIVYVVCLSLFVLLSCCVFFEIYECKHKEVVNEL